MAEPQQPISTEQDEHTSAPPPQQPVRSNSDKWATPAIISPPFSKSPPTDGARSDSLTRRDLHRNSEPVDPAGLSRALNNLERGGREREHTPGASPSRKRPRIYGDRFIPTREGRDYSSALHLIHDDASPATPSKSKKRAPNNDINFQRCKYYTRNCHMRLRLPIAEEANRTFSSVLRSEMFDDTIPTALPAGVSADPLHIHSSGGRSGTPPANGTTLSATGMTPSTPHKNLFQFKSPRHHSLSSPQRTPSNRRSLNLNPQSELYSLSPVKLSSQNMLLSPRKMPRAVSKVPYKVLDAPELADDFYLNLVDWGSSNILGVGLGASVYMWNSSSGKVVRLCELGDDPVTSVNWIQRGSHVAIGTSKGFVQIWDAEKQRKLRTMTGHTGRVGALAWNEHVLSSGSRDRAILHRDVRSPDQYFQRLTGHKQEICGLKWNGDDGQLASGGNDNKLFIWDRSNTEPLYKFNEHTAAVKAIAWSPHQRGLLASGGGTADRKIRFWNTTNGSMVQEVDTGSQVCNLAWSKNSNEIVSTHGYSQNQIVIWKYPSMSQVVSLTGHTYRVLYLAMSPDGQIIVTGAGDETLRFWNCFKKKDPGASSLSKLDNIGVIR